MGLKREDAFPSKYIKKEDCDPPVVDVIAAIEQKDVQNMDGKMERLNIVEFRNGTKPLILKSTNWGLIEAIYGPDTDNWIGKPIELFNDKTVFFRGKSGGIRCRKPSNAGPLSAPPSVPTAAAAHLDTGLLTFPMAVEIAAKHGMTKEQVVELAKSKGNKGWDAARDTAWFRAHLLTIGPAEPGAVEEEVPF